MVCPFCISTRKRSWCCDQNPSKEGCEEKILQGRLIFRDGRFVFMMKNNNVGKLRRNLKIYFGKLVKMLKNAIVEVPKNNDGDGTGVDAQVQTTGTGTGVQTSTTTPSTTGTGTGTGTGPTPQTTVPTTNPLPQTIVCLGAKPTTGTGTQPTTPTGPIPTTPTTTPTTTTPTTTKPVPESAAVTNNRNAQVVKATQANQAFGQLSCLVSHLSCNSQPSSKVRTSIRRMQSPTNRLLHWVRQSHRILLPHLLDNLKHPPFLRKASNPNPAIPAKIAQARKDEQQRKIDLFNDAFKGQFNQPTTTPTKPATSANPIRFFHRRSQPGPTQPVKPTPVPVQPPIGVTPNPTKPTTNVTSPTSPTTTPPTAKPTPVPTGPTTQTVKPTGTGPETGTDTVQTQTNTTQTVKPQPQPIVTTQTTKGGNKVRVVASTKKVATQETCSNLESHEENEEDSLSILS